MICAGHIQYKLTFLLGRDIEVEAFPAGIVASGKCLGTTAKSSGWVAGNDILAVALGLEGVGSGPLAVDRG